MKRIAYFGGYFWAEHSMWHSFKANGVDIVFPCESIVPYGTCVQRSGLKEWLDSYKPDVIVNRMYMNYHRTYAGLGDLARSMSIPYVVYRAETDPGIVKGKDDVARVNCDLFLYAHPYDEQFLDPSDTPTDVWHYGVGPYEKNLHIDRTVMVAGFGTQRSSLDTRRKNLAMFVSGVYGYNNERISVPWASNDGWDDLSYGLTLSGEFGMEYQTLKMNECRVAINFETCPSFDGFYAHKMFQTVGCGVPTITYRKNSLDELFCGSLVQVECAEEVTEAMKMLEDNETWNKFSATGEEVVHCKFDWFRTFNDILKKHNIGNLGV